MTNDVVIVNLPKMLGSYFPAAPAILKGICNHIGVRSIVIDLNLDFLMSCRDADVEIQDLVGIIDGAHRDDKLHNHISVQVNAWTKKILAEKPKVVAISLFSYYAQGFARPLIELIKKESPTTTIVIGGSGLKTSLNDAPTFAENLKKTNLIDHYIVDDGEIPWFDFLVNQFDCSLDQTNLLVSAIMPDYSDYPTEVYQQFAQDTMMKKIIVPLVGSKGCVRKCDFCEIHQHWKFQQRTAEHIEKEVVHILEKVPDPHIHFTDSLINGSLSEFQRILHMMSRLRKTRSFSWGGQFIAREVDQFGEDMWKLMSESSCNLVEVGVETGSESLRYQMNKKFTNAALDYMMEMMEKYQVRCSLLMFVGHPYETDDDFEQTVKMLERYAPYNKSVVYTLQLGYAMAIQPGTPLYDNRKSIGIVVSKNPTIWINQNNPTLTFDKRLERRTRLSELATDLGYTLAFDNHIALSEYQYNKTAFQNQIKVVESILKKK